MIAPLFPPPLIYTARCTQRVSVYKKNHKHTRGKRVSSNTKTVSRIQRTDIMFVCAHDLSPFGSRKLRGHFYSSRLGATFRNNNCSDRLVGVHTGVHTNGTSVRRATLHESRATTRFRRKPSRVKPYSFAHCSKSRSSYITANRSIAVPIGL